MTAFGPLKLALKRGALVTAANWPVVVVQFVADSLFKALLAVPIAGGVVLVVLLAGGNPSDFFRLPPSTVVPRMVAVLLAQPAALAAFLGALGLVVAGGSVMMFAVKAGTVTVLLAAERAAGAIEQPPLRFAALQQAACASVDLYAAGVRRLFGRYLALGLGLSTAYLAMAGAFLAVVSGASPDSVAPRLVAVVASLALIAGVTAVNVVYLLLQIVVAADDCSVAAAVPTLARLLRRRAALVLRILAAIVALMALSTAASILATAALGLIAFVPFVGLAALPLQLCAWLIRGVVFEYVSLTGAAAYTHVHAALRPARLAAEPALSPT